MYKFYFVFDVPDFVFSIYTHPLFIRVNIEYNSITNNCAVEISISSNSQLLWESRKEISAPSKREED